MNAYKNAKFALVIAEPTGPESEAQSKWREFSVNLSKHVQLAEPVLSMHENVWQIPLNTHMLTLAQLIVRANANPVRLRVLFLDEEPDWIQYQPENPASSRQDSL